MAKIGNILIIAGVLLLGFFAYELFTQNKASDDSLQEAAERISQAQKENSGIVVAQETEQVEKESNDVDEGRIEESADEETNIQTEAEVKKENKDNSKEPTDKFQAGHMEAFAILEIPKIGKQLAIVEGADENALDRGVGHMEQTAYPGQDEQIVLAGHRDTVFRDFGKLEIGDTFIVHMPYGKFEYQIRETEIVHADDTSVVRSMGEEVLVVSTCYPFNYFASATERFVAYAYPVD